MMDTDKIFCSILLDILEEKGIRDIVCSPGSRNAPLLIGVSERETFKKHFVVDERSAAFVALGLALVSRKPVALICTSGTALLNYSPAIAEAYYQGVPLIVISADRPLQWIDQDDSQTIRQNNSLANFVKNSYSIPALGEGNPELRWYVNRIVNDACISAVSGKKGPVHINIALGEPLGNIIQKNCGHPRVIEFIEADTIGNKEKIKDLAQKLSESKVLLTVGFMPPDSSLQKALTAFSRFPNVVVMAETISNLHLDNPDFSIDSVLTSCNQDFLDLLAPDIVISLGGSLVSRKLKEYLRRNAGSCTHWAVGYNHTTADPFTSISLRIEVEPARFFRTLNHFLNKRSFDKKVVEYKGKWQELRLKALALKQLYLQSSPWSELTCFDFILKNLPTNFNLFLSNGTPIRYAQIINYNLPHASYCNRGVSGIDGSLSSAIGGAMAYNGTSLLISGDLSFSYDVGALGIKNIPDRLKIIVIDNQGGGIFRFIPSTSPLPMREDYFCMPPALPLAQLADGYGWKYFEAVDKDSLARVFPEFIREEKKSILKIKCDGPFSAEVLKNYMKIQLPCELGKQ